MAWQMLKNGGFADHPSTVLSADAGGSGVLPGATLTPGTNIPASKLKNAGWEFDSKGSANYVILTKATTMATGSATTAAQNFTANPALPGPDALSIDTKIDDGVVDAGKVRGYTATIGTACDYKNNNATGDCALAFQVDPNS